MVLLDSSVNVRYPRVFRQLGDFVDPSAVRRLDAYLGSVEQGNLQDLRTPLWEGRPREEVVEEWAKILYPTGFGWLDEFEQGEQAKIGPFSPRAPYAVRAPEVKRNFQPRRYTAQSQAMRDSFSRRRQLISQKLRPADLETAIESAPTGTNSGLPYHTNIDMVLEEYRGLAHDMERGLEKVIPALLFWRGQPSGPDELPKQRTVWGVPKHYVWNDLRTQIPYLYAARPLEQYAAWNDQPTVDRVISRLLALRGIKISSDFASYDTTLPGQLIALSYELDRERFDSEAFPLIDISERVMLEIGLVTPEGVLEGRDGGVASGKGDTNKIDSDCQLLAISYAENVLGFRNLGETVLGDDGVYVPDKTPPLNELADAYADLNLEANPSKQHVSKDSILYLQRMHHISYQIDGVNIGVRSSMRTLNGMLSWERLPNDNAAELLSLRSIQQMEQLAGHPKHEEFVRFAYKGDKFLRQFTLDELVTRVGGIAAAESALGVAGFPFRIRRLTGLDSFVTVDILRRISSE
jgi:hypothetical protein